jgi:4,5-dihydroxyphthalate decarboxylase
MNKLALTGAMPDYDHVRDIVMGRVQVEGIDFRLLTLQIEEIFYRFLVHKEWDVSEVSFAKYVAFTANGEADFLALPVFPSRVFRQSSLFVRTGGGIKKITDLAGKKVGLPEWAQTAAVYSRGFLTDEYGIKLSSIHWVQAGVNQPGRVEKVDVKLPDGVKLDRVADKSLNQMLLDGDIDAVFVARPPDAFLAGDKRIKRFFDDFLDVEAAYYKKTSIFPIMHAVAVRKRVLDANPWVARNLFKAFEEARARSVHRALDATATMFPIPWVSEYAARGVELMGDDYFPYGVEKNRKTLEVFLRWAFEQGVCKRHLSVEELFPKQMYSSFKV